MVLTLYFDSPPDIIVSLILSVPVSSENGVLDPAYVGEELTEPITSNGLLKEPGPLLQLKKNLLTLAYNQSLNSQNC